MRETLAFPTLGGDNIIAAFNNNHTVESNFGLKFTIRKEVLLNDTCVVPLADLSVGQPEDEVALVVHLSYSDGHLQYPLHLRD